MDIVGIEPCLSSRRAKARFVYILVHKRLEESNLSSYVYISDNPPTTATEYSVRYSVESAPLLVWPDVSAKGT
jgi:hypothetical protein